MARRLKTSNIALIVVGGFVGIVVLDHYVLKGKLGISGQINKLIGMLKQKMGQGAGPIQPATLPPEGLPPSTAEETPEQLAEELAYEQEVDTEPETAMLARMRARRSAYYGRRKRVRLGGYGI